MPLIEFWALAEQIAKRIKIRTRGAAIRVGRREFIIETVSLKQKSKEILYGKTCLPKEAGPIIELSKVVFRT
jgi:hypothetical protein